MPTYEYECKSCGHNFDVFQRMIEDPLKICPQCGKELRRLINGGTGVIFKGSGFYVTDKNSAPKKAVSASSKPDAAAKEPSKEAVCASCARAEACPAGSGAAEKKAAGE